MTISVKKLREDAVLPTRATEGSAGYDLYACLDTDVEIRPNTLVKIPTGIAIALPGREHVALIYARSGLAVKHGIALSNGVGVVDSDYRGEILVGMCNLSKDPYTIHPGERIAQMVITPVSLPALELTDSLDETERGAGGFGSTGKS